MKQCEVQTLLDSALPLFQSPEHRAEPALRSPAPIENNFNQPQQLFSVNKRDGFTSNRVGVIVLWKG
jgi:hypothetical protein